MDDSGAAFAREQGVERLQLRASGSRREEAVRREEPSRLVPVGRYRATEFWIIQYLFGERYCELWLALRAACSYPVASTCTVRCRSSMATGRAVGSARRVVGSTEHHALPARPNSGMASALRTDLTIFGAATVKKARFMRNEANRTSQ